MFVVTAVFWDTAFLNAPDFEQMLTKKAVLTFPYLTFCTETETETETVPGITVLLILIVV